MFLNMLAVGCGGFIGAALRYVVSVAFNKLALATTGQASFLFPVGTFAINFVGCFAMGFLASWLPRQYPGASHLLLFATTGFIGGFTTLSTFGLDAYNLFLRGEHLLAAFYAFGTFACCFVGIVAGVACSKAVTAQ